MKFKIVSFVFALCTFSSCDKVYKTRDFGKVSDTEIQRLADSLAQKYIIVDGHVDLPYRLSIKNFRLEREYLGIPVSTREGDFDYERARKGGLDAPFMSIYIPSANQQKPDMGKSLADELINMIEG